MPAAADAEPVTTAGAPASIATWHTSDFLAAAGLRGSPEGSGPMMGTDGYNALMAMWNQHPRVPGGWGLVPPISLDQPPKRGRFVLRYNRPVHGCQERMTGFIAPVKISGPATTTVDPDPVTQSLAGPPRTRMH